MNYSDSARIKAVLTNCGFAHVDNIDQADIVVLDTCSVRQKSEDKVWWQIRELRPDQKVWLTGCMIQHNLNLKKTRTTKSKKYQHGNFVGNVIWAEPVIVGLIEMEQDKSLKTRIRKFMLWEEDATQEMLYVNHAFDPLFKQMQKVYPNVELFFRINDVGILPYVLSQIGYEVNPDIEVVNEYTSLIPQSANIFQKEQTKTAYVPISSWCSQFCAYCIVPYARGLEKNRPIDEVLNEVNAQVKAGAEEVVLLGQIVNKHPDFYKILKATCETPGVKWVRYTSPYPTYYTNKIFALHQDAVNLCPHIHMPLQSGSNTVLKKMFRGYTAEEYLQFVDWIRALKRPISITSDVIVGFCDETEEDFQQTLRVCAYSKFDMIYMWMYSPRPGTYAYKKYIDNVPIETKKERRTRLNELLISLSQQNNQSEVGTHRQIVVRQKQDEVVIGYTDNMKNMIVDVSTDQLATTEIGNFLDVQVVRTEAFKLFWKVV